MLLAGGQGSRLGVLTGKIAKPAVPYGGKYRIIDFPLSNCTNSGIDTVGILTQYKPLELNDYVGSGKAWDLDRLDGGVHILPPYQGQQGGDWYKGTANAIYQNLSFIERYNEWDVRGPGAEGRGTLDTKRWGWFYGPIYDSKGEKILQDKTDKVEAIVTKDIVLHKDAKSDDPLSGATWNSGARLLKYEVDRAKANQWGENDFVLFRYADVLWMREEAAVRCGAARISSTPEFKKMLSRTFAYSENPETAYEAAYGDVASWSLDQICDERGREFAWENVRRRDLIRFGKFNNPSYVQFVSNTDVRRNWFPIPYSVLEKSLRDENGNRIWTQNPGY